MATDPDYILCLNCETPCYSFEYEHGNLTEAQCMMCGEEDLDMFATEEEFDALSADPNH